MLPVNQTYNFISIDEYIDHIKKFYPHGFGFKLENIQLGIPEKKEDSTYFMFVDLLKNISGTTYTNTSEKGELQLRMNLRFSYRNDKLVDMKILDIGRIDREPC